ncbi:MAG TPA: twin-arginine translocase TatA/TatE family subunit [Terriglobales bacterium]|nr:twin-arginine translocase TatA/TatE family subunit [Terriglobales bacterium]
MFDGLLQPTHLIIILIICLLVFGPKKLPELGRGLGESIREFKKSMAEARAEQPSEPAKAAEELAKK